MYNKFVSEKKKEKLKMCETKRNTLDLSYEAVSPPVLDPFFSVYLFDVCANGWPHIAFIVIIIIGRPAN